MNNTDQARKVDQISLEIMKLSLSNRNIVQIKPTSPIRSESMSRTFEEHRKQETSLGLTDLEPVQLNILKTQLPLLKDKLKSSCVAQGEDFCMN
ncbi:hypothetical protein F511_03469 [Dorcoceras hygrometricum]|uniref:Uncharacterized protein n=1 Tax=Dorcoceras hygrometricum TaxID=472368 RepID=A0A2Z7ABG3_9LAMI|nr:hypothetical protein F511_03469 [Dorcoceras hygrometricum]